MNNNAAEALVSLQAPTAVLAINQNVI